MLLDSVFIGWARVSFEKELEEFSQKVLCDRHLTLQTYQSYPNLTFVAYRGDEIEAYISAYMSQSSLTINNFHYKEDIDDSIKERLVDILLQNVDKGVESISVLAHKEEKDIFEKSGFTIHSRFSQALYSGDAVAFNFSNAMAKRISGENFLPIMRAKDKKAYREDRGEYLSNIMKQSSLVLSTPNGYQHSSVLSKGLIKISPWVMEDASYTDSEQLLRGVIHHRGLKKLIAFIPSDVKEITDLYRSYNFELTNNMLLMYSHHKPQINLEMIYAY